MATRDPNSQDSNASEKEVGKTVAERRSQFSDNKPVPQDIGWTRGERRHPDNARIRRWMNLGDKALQDTSEGEEENPLPK
jgi:hypothetical protein